MNQNSTTLIHESPLLLLPTLAQVIGLNAALFLQQLHYWLGQCGHVHDGHIWVYNTKEQWQAQFPFWSCSTIKRIISRLRKQGIIHTTDEYNACPTDRKLWYTIDYARLNEIMGGDASFALDQDEPVEEVDLDSSADQDEPLPEVEAVSSVDQGETVEEVNLNNSVDQIESSDEVNLDQSTGQNDPSEQVNVDRSLYRTETTYRDYDRDYPETTATTPAPLDRACEDPAPPEESVVVALTSHGLSYPMALGFAQQYSDEYLQEKIAFLEYELDHHSNLTNPAGWLRRAIEQDYSPPSGYQAAQEIEAQAEEWQAFMDEYDRQTAAYEQTQAEAEATRMAEKDAHVAEEAARFYPLYGTTETLIRAWEEGYRYVAEFMSCGGFLGTLEQSVLLSFADGHGKIGVKCQHALQRLQLFGKQALRSALSFAMEDMFQGRKASYELVLI